MSSVSVFRDVYSVKLNQILILDGKSSNDIKLILGILRSVLLLGASLKGPSRIQSLTLVLVSKNIHDIRGIITFPLYQTTLQNNYSTVHDVIDRLLSTTLQDQLSEHHSIEYHEKDKKWHNLFLDLRSNLISDHLFRLTILSRIRRMRLKTLGIKYGSIKNNVIELI